MKFNKYDHGFTLIELLVTVSIIGVLAAIAIPQFSSYRARSFDARSLQDLRSAATAEEAYFVDYERYANCIGAAACEAALPAFSASAGVTVYMFRVNIPGTPEYFTGRTFHPKGNHYNSATAWNWDSNGGGLQ